jgi:precorrin-6B methylase 1
MSSRVYLVGAGPGDPDLLTLGAQRAIEQAQVILYDGLINEQILEFAPADCERICVGKRGNGGAWTQPQIDDLIVKAARDGQRVVRLKGGDTAVPGSRFLRPNCKIMTVNRRLRTIWTGRRWLAFRGRWFCTWRSDRPRVGVRN